MNAEKLKSVIKELLVEHGKTWQDIAALRNEKNANNLHNKFKKGTIRFNEVQEILKALNATLVIKKSDKNNW